MTAEEKELEKNFDKDLIEMVNAYRTLKTVGLWLAAIFTFALAVIGVIKGLQSLKTP